MKYKLKHLTQKTSHMVCLACNSTNRARDGAFVCFTFFAPHIKATLKLQYDTQVGRSKMILDGNHDARMLPQVDLMGMFGACLYVCVNCMMFGVFVVVWSTCFMKSIFITLSFGARIIFAFQQCRSKLMTKLKVYHSHLIIWLTQQFSISTKTSIHWNACQ